MTDYSGKRPHTTPRERGFLFERDAALHIGQIYREHGVKGFCKAHIFSQSDENLAEGRPYWLVTEDKNKAVRLAELSHVGRYFLLRFTGLESPEDLIPWRKAGLWMNKENLARDGGELYDFEWPGFDVLQNDGRSLGHITEVIYTPLRNFLVRKADGAEVIIPSEKSWITNINQKKKQVVMNLPEGIVDL